MVSGGCRGGDVLTVLIFGYRHCQKRTDTDLQHDPAVVTLAAGFTANSRNVGTVLSFLSAVLMSYFRYIPQSFLANAGGFSSIRSRPIPSRSSPFHCSYILMVYLFIATASENNEPKAFGLQNVDEDVQAEPIYCYCIGKAWL